MKSRQLFLFCALWLSTSLSAQFNGTCGNNLTWSLSGGILTVSGTGNMTDWNGFPYVPWVDVRQTINQVIINPGVTNVGEYAFWDCENLTSVTIPNSVTKIGMYSFMLCDKLSSVFIPNRVDTIGNYAFAGCTSIPSVSIPNSVKHIGTQAFDGCSSLTNLELGTDVATIERYAFLRCRNLRAIYSFAPRPPVLEYGAFENVDKSIPLYVITSSVPLYQAADGWKDFTNIIGSLSAVETITAEESATKKLFDNGQLYILLPNGTRFDSTGKKIE